VGSQVHPKLTSTRQLQSVLKLAGTSLADLGPASWSVLDQAVVSLGSFLTSIALARSLSNSDYGVYSTLVAVLLFLHGIHNSLIVTPLLIQGAACSSSERRRRFTASALFTGLLALPSMVVVLVLVVAWGRQPLWLWAPAALATWQLQETMRRSLMCSLSHRRAVLGDAISYLGQAALMWHGLWAGWVSLERAFVVMAITSAAAALIQALQLKPAPVEIRELRETAKSYWAFGRWILYTSFASVLSAQAFHWVLSLFQGPEATASFQAALNVLGIAHPLMFGLGNLLAPAISKANVAAGSRVAWRTTQRHGIHFGLLLLPYFSLVFAVPSKLLSWLYGPISPYLSMDYQLRLLSLAYCLLFFAHINVSFLTNIGDVRSTFNIQLLVATLSIGVALPLAAIFGSTGACAGVLLVNLAKFLFAFYFRRCRTFAAVAEPRTALPDAVSLINSSPISSS